MITNFYGFLFNAMVVVLTLVGGFLVLILLNMVILKKDAKESAKTILDFFQNVLSAFENSSAQATTYFNILIGYNGQTVRAEIVELYFQDLQKFFETVYFTNCQWYTRNVALYTFRAYNPTKFEDSPQRLARVVKQVSEKALMRHFHRQGIAPAIDPFVAVIIQADELRVYIAANNLGFEEIEELRKQMF